MPGRRFFIELHRATALSGAGSAERETEGVLSAPRGLRFDRHGVPGWTTAAPRPCHAGTDRFQSRTVENRIPQTCAPPQVWTQALFFSTAAAATFLLARQKKSGGRILMGKAHLWERSLGPAERASADRAGICAASREFCPGGAYRCSPDRVFPQGCFRASVRTPSSASGPSS